MAEPQVGQWKRKNTSRGARYQIWNGTSWSGNRTVKPKGTEYDPEQDAEQINSISFYDDDGNYVGDQFSEIQEDNKKLDEVTKSEINIDESNKSVFESLTDGQISRILLSAPGDTVEGVNVTVDLLQQLNQFQLEKSEEYKLNSEEGAGQNDSVTSQGVNSTNSEPKMHKRESIGFSEALAAAKKESNIFSSTSDPCGGKVNAIKLALTSMFNTLRDIKKYGGEYIDGITSQMANIRNLIRDTADVIATALRSVVQRLRNFVISTVRKAIGEIADKIFTSLTQSLKDTIVQKVVDALLCTFTKILTGLGNFVGDFLKELVGKVVNIPLCAAQQFANSLINNLAAKIDNAIAPILDGINDMIGGVGKIAGSVFSAIDTILGFESYLCLNPDCPEVNSINFDPSKLGPISSVKDVFDGFKEAKIPTAAGIGKSVTNYIEDFSIFGTKVGDMQEEQEWISCDTNPLKCGMPTIEIFGGGGDGAYATAVVDQLGHVIGADLAEKGAKYITPPFVAIIDPCDIGQGASAYSELNDDGEVERIVVVNTGNGYNNQPVSDVDVGTTSDYIVCLDALEIISTGIGYAPTDEIVITPDIPNLEVSVQMNEEGQIIQMQVLNSVCGITEMPDIDINSETGAGIQVRPVLSFNKLESPAQVPNNIVDVDISDNKDNIRILAQQQNIVRVIDCVS